MTSRRRIYLLALILTAIAGLWIAPLGRSLWLDETATYWVVKDGLPTAVERASSTQPHSPLYYVLAWGALVLGGAHEVVLRLPSVMAMAVAAFLLYQLGTRLVDQEFGLLAAIVLVSFRNVVFATVGARPYALALLLVVAAVLALVRWLARGRTIDGVSYVLAASLTVYAHFLFATMFLVHAVIALERKRAGTPVSWKALAVAATACGLLMLPLVPQFLSLMGRTRSLSWAEDLSVPVLLGRFAWGLLIFAAAILLGVLLARASGRFSFRPPVSADLRLLLVLIAWIAIPPLVILGVTLLTPANIFVSRYYLGAVAGLALLVAWGIRGWQSSRARAILAGAIVLVSVVGSQTLRLSREGEDWRGAAQAARGAAHGAQTPVLMRAGFIESAWPEVLSDPAWASYLNAPVSFYPINQNTIPLPYRVDRSSQGYLERLASSTLERTDRFLLVTRGDPKSFQDWLEARLAPSGFAAQLVGRYGSVWVVGFTRPRSTSSRATFSTAPRVES